MSLERSGEAGGIFNQAVVGGFCDPCRARAMKISKDSALIALFLIAFRILLDASYIWKISEVYAYQGFVTDIRWQQYCVSWIVFLSLIPVSLRRRGSVSSGIYFVLFACGFIPMSSYYGLTASDTGWFMLCALFWALVSYVSDIKLPSPRFKRPKTLVPVVAVAGAFGLATWAIVVLHFGVSFRLSFDDVYEIRAENTLSGIPLGGYVVPWAGKVALPALAILGLRRGGASGKAIFASAVLMEIMIFATTGHKAFIFSMLLMVSFYFVAVYRSRMVLISGGLFAVVASCYVLDSLFDSTLWSGFITRRAFFVPASLSDAYHQFFDGRFMYLSHSIFSPWVENPFHMAPSRAIGQQFFGSDTLNANNGVVGDGYMNFGVWGVFAWAVLLGLLISAYEAVSRSVDPRFAFAVGMTVFLTFINGGLLVTLLTHGVLLALCIVMLCPSDISGTRVHGRATKYRRVE